MSKSRRCGCLGLSVVAAAMTLIAAAPAGALGAGEESAPTETAAPEAAAPVVAPPASTGWIPQGGATETSSDGAAPTRHGSSLGSGGGPSHVPSTSEEPSYTTGSSGQYEPESSAPSTFEEPARTPQMGSGFGSVEPPATASTTGKAVSVAVGAATPVALAATPVSPSESPQGGSIGSAPLAAAAPFTNPRDQVASNFDALPLLVGIVLGLILVYAGVRRWRRRQLEALWRRQDAEWEAVVRRVELERAPGASKPSPERLRRVEVGSDFVLSEVPIGRAASQGPRRAKGKPAKAK
jgi:hypothetical protein